MKSGFSIVPVLVSGVLAIAVPCSSRASAADSTPQNIPPSAAAAAPSYKHRERTLFAELLELLEDPHAAKPPCAG